MDPHRGMAHGPRDYPRDYPRSHSMAAGGGISSSDGPMAPPRGGIPPSSVPSLSTGQGFYTVESLQGATVVPPPQLAPPPPRILPPADPYPVDRFDPRSHLRPDERAFRPPVHRGHPLPPPRGRRMMPYPEFARGGPRMMHPPPPPFMGDPRGPPFHPGREPLPPRERGWGPARGFGRRFPERRMDPGFERSQRIRGKKQSQKKTKPEAKSTSSGPTAVEQTPAAGEGGPGWCSVCQINCFKAETLEKHIAGKRHKKQLESLKQADGGNEAEANDKADQKDEIMTDSGNVDAAVMGGEQGGDEAAEKVVDSEVADKTLQGAIEAVEKAEEVMKDTAEKAEAGVNEVAAKSTETIMEVAKKAEELEPTNFVQEVPEPGKDHPITGEDEKESVETSGVTKISSPLAGRKRGAKDGAVATKKRRKSDAENATVANKANDDKKGLSDTSDVCEVCNVTFSSKAGLETHLKSKKHAAQLKKNASSPSVKNVNAEGKEQQTPAKENLEVDKELTETADLVNGKTGQSAEVQ